MSLRGIGCIAVLVWIAVVGSGTAAEAALIINEVLADPPAALGDANGDGERDARRDEFIELVNTAAASVELAGWTVSDRIGIRHTFTSASTIAGHGLFVIFGGGAPVGFGASATVASSRGLGLNNGGDTITLRDDTASVVDVFLYGAEGGMDTSLTRWPDATGPFHLHASISDLSFSPGTTVDGRRTLLLAEDEEALFPEPSSGDRAHPSVPEPASFVYLGAGILSLMRRFHRRS